MDRFSRPGSEIGGLRHIVVAGGTNAEWEAFSDQDWSQRLTTLADGARQAGARYVTIHPFEILKDPHGASPLVQSSSLRRRVLTVPFGSPHAKAEDSITVVADPAVDGRQRICDIVANWPAGRDITEETLGQALFGPAGEPDLVVILGPPHRLPASLVWELAYSELVFLPTHWSALSLPEVVGAVHEFSRRNRRFGGVEE